MHGHWSQVGGLGMDILFLGTKDNNKFWYAGCQRWALAFFFALSRESMLIASTYAHKQGWQGRGNVRLYLKEYVHLERKREGGWCFFTQIEPNWPLPYRRTVPCQYNGWGMPCWRAGSPIAVYAREQCREPKTGQKKVQFYCKDDATYIYTPIYTSQLFIHHN